MMLVRLALMAALTPPTVAAAACHHFTIWHYRYPQRCYTARVAPEARTIPAALVQPAPPKVTMVPQIPVPALRPMSDEEKHALGIEVLKLKMQEQK
jgi:hypothetical protein